MEDGSSFTFGEQVLQTGGFQKTFFFPAETAVKAPAPKAKALCDSHAAKRLVARYFPNVFSDAPTPDRVVYADHLTARTPISERSTFIVC